MKTKEEIKRLLTNDERLRDSDAKLIARFWTNELKRKNIDTKDITAHEFLSMYATSKLHNVEGLTRMRRKVQEENEHLRGKLYKERQTTQQDKMKAKLGYNVKMSSDYKRSNYPIQWLF
jgi:hypothetical protein|tara:strand:+ start:1183 stop:1539 length:357 start_codon:yes stop_codon:yes gene_type:complete